MCAVILKELKSYFKSMFGWIFLAVFTFFAGLYYLANNIMNGSPYIKTTLGSLVVVIIFILPLLTMRIIADEKRQKTDQLLITAPISLWKVVLGKFIAICTILFAATILLLIGTLVLSIYGSIPWAESFVDLLVFFLFACALSAIGMFMSSITEHQFLSAIFTYFAFIFMLLAPQFANMIFGTEKLISKILNIFDIYTRFDDLMSGMLDIPSALYLISATVIFLLLTYKVFAKESVQISAVGTNRFFLSSLGLWAVIAAIVILNVGSTHIPDKYSQFDITAQGYFSVGEETKTMLSSLDKDVTIYVLAAEGEADQIVKRYLNNYDSLSKHVKVIYKSMNDYPMFYMDYSETAPSGDSLIVTCGEDYRVIDYNELYEYEFDQYTYTYNVTGSNIESLLTASINSFINGDNKLKAYCLAGHDELSVPVYITDVLSKNGFVFEDLSLIQTKEVPSDCDLLIVNNPQADISESDAEAIRKYADNAGNIIFVAALGESGTDDYDNLINSFGVTITEGTVLEANANYMDGDNPAVSLSTTDMNSIFSISQKKMMLMYMPRGFVYDEENLPEDTSINTIILSSNQSYEKLLRTATDMNKDDTCNDGPFPLAVYIKQFSEEVSDYSNIVMIGSPAFLYNDFDAMVSNANSELIVNAVQHFLPNELNCIVPTKSLTYDTITVSRGVLLFDILICEIIIPLAMLISGIVIAISRRRK